MRTLEEWLAHQAQLHPQAIELGLERLQAVLQRLGWRQPSAPVITVAGTNGKGSVVAYCTAMLRAAGCRVGSFTSPHLNDYRERIRVHDGLATAAQLVAAFERIDAARREAPAISLTFFEYNALAAFLIFEAAQLDAWVLEVGMGGRLDAVNAVEPTVAVVVSVGFDHQEYLGNSLEEIATEKAGIFRRGRSAVIGSRDAPLRLYELALARGAVPKRLGVEFDSSRQGVRGSAGSWRYRGTRWDFPCLPPPALRGETQIANAATAIAALEELPLAVPLEVTAVAQGLEAVSLAGRFQVIAAPAGGVQWILDVAHNPDAARVLADNLRQLPCAGRSLAVCGVLADKDAAAIAAVLRPCFAAWWLTDTDGARGSRAAELAVRIAGEISAPITLANDVAAACAAAQGAAVAGDRIVVFGSFHTVGPALDWLRTAGLLHTPAPAAQ